MADFVDELSSVIVAQIEALIASVADENGVDAQDIRKNVALAMSTSFFVGQCMRTKISPLDIDTVLKPFSAAVKQSFLHNIRLQ